VSACTCLVSVFSDPHFPYDSVVSDADIRNPSLPWKSICCQLELHRISGAYTFCVRILFKAVLCSAFSH